MPTINDPDGQAAKVFDERVWVESVSELEVAHVNDVHKEAYRVLVDITSATTDDDFFYLQNTRSDAELILTRIEGWVDDASQEIKILIGATDAGTAAGDALVPANLNSGSGNSATVVCTQDATDLAITGGTVVDLLKFPPVALTRAVFAYPEGIILQTNQRLHMEAALAGLINLNITFYYH